MDINLADIAKTRAEPQTIHNDDDDLEHSFPSGLNLAGVDSKDISKKRQGPFSQKQRRKKPAVEKDTNQKEADLFEPSPPTPGLQNIFQWNSTLADAFQTAKLLPQDHAPSCHIFGHYEFAGGGGAEVATAAVAASSQGSVTADIVTQSDWDKGKRKVLEMNMEGTCRFSDIMDTIDCPHEVTCGMEVEIELSQEDILSSMGLRRCRLRDDQNGSDSSFVASPSKSGSYSRERASSCNSDSSSGSPSSSSCSNPGSHGSKSGVSLVPSTDETVVPDPNEDVFIDSDELQNQLASLFDKKHCLKRPVGNANEGWLLCSAKVALADAIYMGMNTDI